MERSNIPSQVTGKKLDIFEHRAFTTREDVLAGYQRARSRLFEVNKWCQLVGTASAEFKLIDKFGDSISRTPRVGDYVQIDIPGPGSIIGKGYDWVQVTELEDLSEDHYVKIALQPSMPPENLRSRDEVAHFFKASASTNIEITVRDLTLHVNYYGRNEEANTESGLILENMRNALIGIGAKFGLSFPQWHRLITGILEE